MISIRKFNNKDFDAVLDFYHRGFTGEVDRKFEAFKWIQTQNPFVDNENNYILLFSDGKLIGYWGLMPVKFYQFGQPFLALFSQETLVDPSYRRKGLASKLLAEVNSSDRFMVSLWHNEKILAIKKRGAWSNIGHYRPLKKIYKLESLVKRKFRSNIIPQFLTRMAKIYFSIKRSTSKISNKYEVEPIKRCGHEFDNFFMDVMPRLGVLSDRTSGILNWKYLDIPYKKYILLAARKGGNLCGYIVLRIEDQEGNIRKGIIADLLAKPGEPETVACLVKCSDEIFRKNNVDFAVCQVSFDIFRNVFKRYGFYQGKSVYTNSLWIYNDEKCPDSKSVRNLKNWYFTYGDSDGDMW